MAADAVYCAVAGAGIALAASRVGRDLGIAPGLVRTAGVATVGWAGLVAASTQWKPWTKPTTAILAANSVATTTLGMAGVLHHSPAARKLLLVVAGQVGVFAVSQGVALATAEARP